MEDARHERRIFRTSSSSSLVRGRARRNGKQSGLPARVGRGFDSRRLRYAGPKRSNTQPNSRRRSANPRRMERTGSAAAAVLRDKRRTGGEPSESGPPGRFNSKVDKRIRAHLRRMSRVYAYLCHVVRAFGCPSGGRDDSFAARAAAGDRTLLHDCVTRCIRDLDEICSRLDKEIEPRATKAIPGSAAKVNLMRARFEKGKRIFADGDAADGVGAVGDWEPPLAGKDTPASGQGGR